MAQVDEAVAYDSPDAFALRVKYEKHTLFIPVEPSTSYDTILARSLSILATTNTHPPEDCGITSFKDFDAEDVALFIGSTSAVGGVVQDTMRFVELDRTKGNIVSKMGFKDGPDALAYLGFRSKGQKGYSQPIVKIPSLVEDEDEEEADPDAIPPPLYDEDDIMGEPSKGKSKA